jgi:hypothetical protein
MQAVPTAAWMQTLTMCPVTLAQAVWQAVAGWEAAVFRAQEEQAVPRMQ